MTAWALVAGMAAITYALRLSAVALLGRLDLPPIVVRALRFVPPAVLSAIILPEVLRPAGRLDLSVGKPRLSAAAVAAIVARWTGNALATIRTGMAVLWILQTVLK